LLAYLGVGVVALVGIEAGWRSWRGTAPAIWGERLGLALILILVITSAGGLGLLVAGSGPREPLHFLYAVLAIGCMPVADSLLRKASPRRRALITAVAALVALVLIGRLFQTG
jgi:hypothetical protein